MALSTTRLAWALAAAHLTGGCGSTPIHDSDRTTDTETAPADSDTDPDSDSDATPDSGADADTPADSDTSDTSDTAPPETGFWIGFAANFARSGSTCGDEPSGSLGGAGCDIFRAKLAADTFDVVSGSVEQMTTDAAAEVFPAISADGTRILFHTLDTTTARTLWMVDADTATRTNLGANLLYPDWIGADRVAFTGFTAPKSLRVGSLAVGATSLTALADLTTVQPAQDANASADGRYVVFHSPSSGSSPGVHVLDLTAATSASVTTATGYGHCTVSPSGSRVVCDNASGSGLAAWTRSGSAWTGPTTVVNDPTGLASLDADFSGCTLTSVDFPAFCDETHLAVSVSCVAPREGIRFSKVFLADLGAGPTALHPLGGALAARFGGPGHTSWTPSCRTDE